MEIEFKDGFGRPVNLLQLPEWKLPQEICNHDTHFICMIVGDASETSDEQISFFVHHLLERGMVYLCAWGPDCSRVHDLADLAMVEEELETGNAIPVMKTWHSHESLDDALWFALNSAWPDETFEATCNSSNIFVVNNDAWAKHIGQRLSNLEQFNTDVT